MEKDEALRRALALNHAIDHGQLLGELPIHPYAVARIEIASILLEVQRDLLLDAQGIPAESYERAYIVEIRPNPDYCS